jgi:hypothetical protein
MMRVCTDTESCPDIELRGNTNLESYKKQQKAERKHKACDLVSFDLKLALWVLLFFEKLLA